MTDIDVKNLYDTRFNTLERVRKDNLWKVLCRDFLQHYVKKTDSIVDIGAGNCEFINNISAGEKYAVDINDDVLKNADKDVRAVIAPIKHFKSSFKPGSIDVIFMSNLLEHLDSKEEVFRLLKDASDLLKKGGRLLIMQPDIKLVGNSYWDFFDHKTPITFASLKEVLLADGYRITDAKYPFLPYSTKLKFLPQWPFLLKMYLRIRLLHYLFGKQFFVCAEKPR